MNGDRVEAGTTGTIADVLARNWWMLLLRGIAAIIFGILAFIWPKMTLLALIYIFGAYTIISGIMSLTAASNAPKGYPRFGSLIFSGIISIIAGIIAFVWPHLTAMALLILIGAWAIIDGFSEIMAAVYLRKHINNEGWWIVAGIASVIFGIALFLWPRAGILALLWWVGCWAIVFGIMMIGLAFRLHNRGGTTIGMATPAPA